MPGECSLKSRGKKYIPTRKSRTKEEKVEDSDEVEENNEKKDKETIE